MGEALAYQNNIINLVHPDLDAVKGYLNWTQDRIIHQNPARKSSPPRKIAKGDDGQSVAKEKQEKEDYRMLVNLWIFGQKVQDCLFRDIVISMTESMLTMPDSSPQVFITILDPALIKSAWEGTDTHSTLRAFIIDTIARYASNEQVKQFLLAGTGYLPTFQTDLCTRLDHSLPSHQLPSNVKALAPMPIRIPLPYPPYSREMIGRTLADEEVVTGLVPTMGENRKVRAPVQTIDELVSGELSELGRWCVERCGGACGYHEHQDGESYWATS